MSWLGMPFAAPGVALVMDRKSDCPLLGEHNPLAGPRAQGRVVARGPAAIAGGSGTDRRAYRQRGVGFAG